MSNEYIFHVKTFSIIQQYFEDKTVSANGAHQQFTQLGIYYMLIIQNLHRYL